MCLRQDLRDDVISVGDQFFNHRQDAAKLETRLRQLRIETFNAARAVPVSSPEHDPLVCLVLEARKVDHLHREDPLHSLDENHEGTILPNRQ